jgi:hypothetical protein
MNVCAKMLCRLSCFHYPVPSITVDVFLIFLRNPLLSDLIAFQRFQGLTILLLDDFNELGTARLDNTFKRQWFSVEIFSILTSISTKTLGNGMGETGWYSVGVVGVGSSVGMTGFLDVKAPEDACDCDEQGLFSDLLSGTDSATPSEGGIALLIRIREIRLQVSVGVERMWIGIVFRVVINLPSVCFREKMVKIQPRDFPRWWILWE